MSQDQRDTSLIPIDDGINYETLFEDIKHVIDDEVAKTINVKLANHEVLMKDKYAPKHKWMKRLFTTLLIAALGLSILTHIYKNNTIDDVIESATDTYSNVLKSVKGNDGELND